MSGLAQISATDFPSAMRLQKVSAHSIVYLLGRPILAGTCVDRLLVRGGIFITSSWRRDGNAAAFALPALLRFRLLVARIDDGQGGIKCDLIGRSRTEIGVQRMVRGRCP